MKATKPKPRSVGAFRYSPGEMRLGSPILRQEQKDEKEGLLGKVKELESTLPDD